jgi:uncharacterized protein (TIGR02246 family)
LEENMASILEPEQATDEIVAAMVRAWNSHDAHSFAAVFAPDADFTNVFGMVARGREEIEGFHGPIFETMFRDSRLTATQTRVRPIRPDVAAVDIRWEMSGARGPSGDQWPSRRGLMNLVLTREGGIWSIAVMHNMELPMDGMADAQARLQKRHQPAGVAGAGG